MANDAFKLFYKENVMFTRNFIHAALIAAAMVGGGPYVL
jgi:hypothetical protein